ncbi:MAG: sulfurtransferase [Chloroflexi bacterium AL-W]|nr:sulfurtransferase [Chloroflexi bacterium AL-N1]NOK70671.1 sulfurtransferase [Chloroflexi bacterium AL-N10]NOK78490.1 sulfurtransferase [Chloroflexi bacterium AL-N5]NOK85574.1 sulfurtransferase [Chloroflexi bacterium AL-W]NOK92488.1 sulfurtransferase [Chloroflexi bacterium AL-N15]
MLNGGYQKWLAEDRPLVTEFSNPAPKHYQVKSPDASLRVLQPEVLASLNRSDCVLLDVRTLPEFRGEILMEKPPEGSECGGHMPGAVNLGYTQTLNDDETFKSYEELHALFVSQGITTDKEVFPYCAVGGRSAFIWFVLKYLLGYPRVRNYDGSWNEWGRLPNAPIEQ